MTRFFTSDSTTSPAGRTPNRNHIAALGSIIAISIVTYLPAVDRFFISDDFDLFAVIETAEKNPRWFFETTTEFFRLMSYIYFGACYWLFGLSPEPYYWAGIALHAIVSVLVYLLVKELTRSSPAAWTAGLFFAAYERHQEAVMWISAANETILALNCLLFLLLWLRAAERKNAAYLFLAHVMFIVALFSKEAAVVMVPLGALQLVLSGCFVRDVLRKCVALVAMLCAFLLLWLAVAHRNPFVSLHYYAFDSPFLSVYTRSLIRLAAQLVPPVTAWFIIRYLQARRQEFDVVKSGLESHQVVWKHATIFFGAFLLLGIIPYSFLTYLNHIPSRHTYLPSIGLAGLMGIAFAALYARMSTEWSKRLCTLSFCVLLIGNIGYIWVKKVPQYRQRAAPTRELIKILNANNNSQLPMHVCQFPLDPWVFSETVKRFTQFDTSNVVLTDVCEDARGTVIRWDESTSQYRMTSTKAHAD